MYLVVKYNSTCLFCFAVPWNFVRVWYAFDVIWMWFGCDAQRKTRRRLTGCAVLTNPIAKRSTGWDQILACVQKKVNSECGMWMVCGMWTDGRNSSDSVWNEPPVFASFSFSLLAVSSATIYHLHSVLCPLSAYVCAAVAQLTPLSHWTDNFYKDGKFQTSHTHTHTNSNTLLPNKRQPQQAWCVLWSVVCDMWLRHKKPPCCFNLIYTQHACRLGPAWLCYTTPPARWVFGA